MTQPLDDTELMAAGFLADMLEQMDDDKPILVDWLQRNLLVKALRIAIEQRTE